MNEKKEEPSMFRLEDGHSCVVGPIFETENGIEIGEAWVAPIGADSDMDKKYLFLGSKEEHEESATPTLFFTEEGLASLLWALKEAGKKVWPKPLKPLCPASAELLKYLQRYDAITPLKAREELGIEHLPRRIKDLKEHGHKITTRYERGYNGKRYARYSLDQKNFAGRLTVPTPTEIAEHLVLEDKLTENVVRWPSRML